MSTGGEPLTWSLGVSQIISCDGPSELPRPKPRVLDTHGGHNLKRKRLPLPPFLSLLGVQPEQRVRSCPLHCEHTPRPERVRRQHENGHTEGEPVLMVRRKGWDALVYKSRLRGVGVVHSQSTVNTPAPKSWVSTPTRASFIRGRKYILNK